MIKYKLFILISSAALALIPYTSMATENPTDYVKGSAITANVKAKFLADPDIKSTKINVKTNGHKVILNGKIANQDLKQRAESLAMEVDGVTSVKNNLHVISSH